MKRIGRAVPISLVSLLALISPKRRQEVVNANLRAAAEPQPAKTNELPQGVVYRLKIQNTSDAPLYITAILLSNDGGIKVIYPKLNENDPVASKPVETMTLGTTPPSGR